MGKTADFCELGGALPAAAAGKRGDREFGISSMTFADEVKKEVYPYRTVSKTAVISLILGLLSIAAFAAAPLLFVPVCGFFLGQDITCFLRVRMPIQY